MVGLCFDDGKSANEELLATSGAREVPRIRSCPRYTFVKRPLNTKHYNIGELKNAFFCQNHMSGSMGDVGHEGSCDSENMW